jgi:Zn-dependent protease with chaperone function
MSGLHEIASLAGVLLVAITWLVVSLLAPRSRFLPSGRAGSPARRAFAARAWLYAVLWVPPVVLLASFMPGLFGMVIEQGDHCLTHGYDHHHHHLCFLHPPHATGHPLSWAAPLGLALVVAIVLLRCAWRGRSQQRLARALVATSRASQLGDGVRLLDCREPMAVTVGVRAPVILLSTGLIELASARTLEVVLAHEHAHVRRGDTRHARLDRFAAALLPRSVAAPLLEQITLAREQACDAAAVEQIGDPVEVARALTEVARLGLCVPATGVSMGSGALEARVLHLLEPPAPTRHGWVSPALLFCALIVAGAGPVHGAIEHLITFLLH